MVTRGGGGGTFEGDGETDKRVRWFDDDGSSEQCDMALRIPASISFGSSPVNRRYAEIVILR